MNKTNNLINQINEPDKTMLPFTLQELIDEIGYENTLKVVNLYGGCYIYIPKADKLMANQRNEKIRNEFTGCNYDELSKKYKLSTIQIRNICKQNINGGETID